MKSEIEELFALHVRAHRLEPAEREYRFDLDRKWRCDFAWPDYKLMVEIEGGSWSAGRHNRGVGFAADCEKYNQAVVDGWRVLRYTGDMVRSGLAIEQVKAVLGRATD